MWGVAAPDQFLVADLARGDAVNLGHRPVGIVFALDRQDRDLNLRGFVLDVPSREWRIEPRVVPPPERRVGICLVAGEAGPQISGQVGVAGAVSRSDVGSPVR